ncbi:phosphonate ABC transporter, permease protein PhnE [Leptothoe sp. ISB3NOV94-8A]|uniref:Phosphonate ABC transporter, permease protein PhnE n=1 Tax=Adonisia turfae CCMR0081 TaxID=2292702 RepID=A0A6M0REA2_9CYAN|nr:phosphonate ABC transporter, permease protein PhnE [Adonisia turfae]MDV3348745.1 phosphonate ABC transporter, permease protein PhnE [Leptothoe sp. LEGE 181152]NEZ54535.1 phosphonate ABC transporter, permease protein PhnE [Adonisia turfae CCMR0081]
MTTNSQPPDSSPLNSILRQHQRRWLRHTIRVLLLLGLIIISFISVELFNIERMADGIPAIFKLMGEMLPPDFSRFPQWIEPIFDTLAMSIAGTALALGLSLPLGLLAARNTTPHPIALHSARTILNITRAIPELILGMILVAAVGFGKLPGTLALGLHSVGMVGKFFAEAIELSDQAPVEAARAVGATAPQVIVHSILPQVFPQMTDVTFYRWEYNFRASMVLGAVGAGGIGLEIISALRILKYQQVSALLIVVLAMVTLVDGFSNYLRKGFIE